MQIKEMKINGKDIEEAKLNNQIVYRKATEGLQVTITRQPDTITSGTVTVTLKSNKPVSSVTNAGTWLKVDEYTYKKVYPSNSTQTATVTSTDGESVQVTIIVDNIDKAPTITVKTGENETIGDFENKIFSKVSFKLYDNKGVVEYQLNDTIVKISTSQWSDINNITVSTTGAIEGLNTLIVRDTVGNETMYQFTLIA